MPVSRQAELRGGEVEGLVPADALPTMRAAPHRVGDPPTRKRLTLRQRAPRVNGCSGSPPSLTMRSPSTSATTPQASKQSSGQAVFTIRRIKKIPARSEPAERGTPRRTWPSVSSRAGSGDTACRGLPASRAGNGRTGAASLAFRVWRVKDRSGSQLRIRWSARVIGSGPGQFAGRRRGLGTRPGSAGDQRSPEGPGDDAASPRRWWGSIFRSAALR